jgi:hypothetical protein
MITHPDLKNRGVSKNSTLGVKSYQEGILYARGVCVCPRIFYTREFFLYPVGVCVDRRNMSMTHTHPTRI